MNKTLKIALAQIHSKQGRIDDNLATIEDLVKKEKADVIIFPELSTTGYLIHDRIFEYAEKIPNGPISKNLIRMAEDYNTVIITGIPEQTKYGIFYNSAIVVEPSKQVKVTRKVMLPNHSIFNEKRYFRPSHKISPHYVKNLDTILGIQICYDLWAPEISRSLAFQGANILIAISASPGMRQEYFETFIKARALENNAFVIYVNQAGVQDNLSFWGGSRIVDPKGKTICKLKYDEPDYEVAKINLDTSRQAATFIPTLRDTRPWWYQQLEKNSRNL